MGTRTDNFIVHALLDDMRDPTRGAGHDKNGGKKCDGNPHLLKGNGGKPIEIREHLFCLPHDRFDPFGDGIEPGCRIVCGEHSRCFFNNRMTRIRDCVNGVAKAHDNLSPLNARADIGLGLVRHGIALLDLKGCLIGPAMFWPAQRTDRPGHRRVDI